MMELLRIKQWFKNLFIFIPLIFTGTLFTPFIYPTIVGFFALCFISSANYIFNDIIDKKLDQQHPEKKQRAIAKGFPVPVALCAAFILFGTAVLLGMKLPTPFFITLLSLFGITQFYSLYLKNEKYLDVILIGINFILRTIAGAFIIDVIISGWLFIGIFFFALLFGFAKREGDLSINAQHTKIVLKKYSLEEVRNLKLLFGGALMLTYGLYAVSKSMFLIFTIPIFVYGVIRFLFLENTLLYRHPELLYKDRKLLIAGILFFISTVWLL